MAPGNLRQAARRFLDPICARLADEHEEAVLRAEEDRAEAQTWLTLGDNGDGTWTGKFTVPALHGAMLKKALDVLGSPRRTERTPSARCSAGRPDEAGRGRPHHHRAALPGVCRSARAGVLRAARAPPRDRARPHRDLDRGPPRRSPTRRPGRRVHHRRRGRDLHPDHATTGLRRRPAPDGDARQERPARPRHPATAVLQGAGDRAVRAPPDLRRQGCDRPFAWTEIHHRHPLVPRRTHRPGQRRSPSADTTTEPSTTTATTTPDNPTVRSPSKNTDDDGTSTRARTGCVTQRVGQLRVVARATSSGVKTTCWC